MERDWARPVVHFAIEAIDAERQRAFYSALFNWDISDGPIMSIRAGLGAPEAGPGGHLQASTRSAISLYVQVRDLAETLRTAVALGGAVVFERFDVPDGPTLAAITDPEGNSLTLVQQ
jgi:predicted enzyme related to lactoylglutathione lyase